MPWQKFPARAPETAGEAPALPISNCIVPASACLPAPRRDVRCRRAFTLVEMMVAVTLLTVIVFSLYAMFNQTQRAFRSSVTQVDVMESGRAATELLKRELEQLTASQLPDVTNLYAVTRGVAPQYGTNFQQLTDGTIRTNRTEEIFFLSHNQAHWNGTAYFLQAANTNPSDAYLLDAGVGTLYRYTTNAPAPTNNFLLNRFNLATADGWQRVADGVIHFQVRAFDATGQEITNRTSFVADLVPAYLELELAFLEPAAVEQTRGILQGPQTVMAMRTFLTNQAGRVHLFRQRIPVRTATQ